MKVTHHVHDESHKVMLFATLWTTQTIEFSRPEYWSGQPFPSSGNIPNPGIEPRFPTLQAESLPVEPQRKPLRILIARNYLIDFSSDQFSHSVVSDSLRPHESQHGRSPCHQQLPEFTQTHVHLVGDVIQPSYPLLSPSPPASNPSQHQSLFQ